MGNRFFAFDDEQWLAPGEDRGFLLTFFVGIREEGSRYDMKMGYFWSDLGHLDGGAKGKNFNNSSL